MGNCAEPVHWSLMVNTSFGERVQISDMYRIGRIIDDIKIRRIQTGEGFYSI